MQQSLLKVLVLVASVCALALKPSIGEAAGIIPVKEDQPNLNGILKEQTFDSSKVKKEPSLGDSQDHVTKAEGLYTEVDSSSPGLTTSSPAGLNPSRRIASRQSVIWDWLAGLFTTTTTTTTPAIPQRQCPECVCGISGTTVRIVGGQETKMHSYPWQALLLRNDRFFCGGTLITDSHVLTAAHCLQRIRIDELSINFLVHHRKDESPFTIRRRARAFRIHESYSSSTYDNDVAVIALDRPVEMRDNMTTACMPHLDTDYAGEMGIVTGWGTTSESGQISDVLREVEVPIMSHAECQQSSYGSDGVTENMMCAGYKEGGKDSCQGDSGGPLHIRQQCPSKRNRYHVVGVVSWGEGCARPDRPGVYARINRYHEWIVASARDGCPCTLECPDSKAEVDERV